MKAIIRSVQVLQAHAEGVGYKESVSRCFSLLELGSGQAADTEWEICSHKQYQGRALIKLHKRCPLFPYHVGELSRFSSNGISETLSMSAATVCDCMRLFKGNTISRKSKYFPHFSGSNKQHHLQ